MAQYYRLMSFYDDVTIDIITSGINYILQALGITLYMYRLRKKPVINNIKDFVYLLIFGSLFMCTILTTSNGIILQLSGYIFNLLIGMYSAFYLTLFAEKTESSNQGLYFGVAYAIGSIGTYLISLIHNGDYIVSKQSIVLYYVVIAIIIYLALNCENISVPTTQKLEVVKANNLKHLVILIALMTIISTIGSGLYYSLPQAHNGNWYLIRVFYALGLVLAGIIIDRKVFIGEILVVATLIYPLIATSLFNQGTNNTITLSLSYVFRGFITIYYVISFTKLYKESSEYLLYASTGLFVSRIVEGIISIIFMRIALSDTFQLIFSAIMFIPLLIIFVKIQNEKYAIPPISETKKITLFCEKYELTNREKEILILLTKDYTDSGIAEELFISKNTVRFHISNLLKKTNAKSRIDVANLLNKM